MSKVQQRQVRTPPPKDIREVSASHVLILLGMILQPGGLHFKYHGSVLWETWWLWEILEGESNVLGRTIGPGVRESGGSDMACGPSKHEIETSGGGAVHSQGRWRIVVHSQGRWD